MTLSSRHRIRNSSPGGLRPSTLPLGHGGSPQYWLSHVGGEETLFVSFKPPRPGTEPRTLAWKAAVLTTTLGPPPTSVSTRHILGTTMEIWVTRPVTVGPYCYPCWPVWWPWLLRAAILLYCFTKINQINRQNCPAKLFASISRHLKLELLTQYPAWGDEKYR